MLETFLFIGLPYLAVIFCLIGCVYRFRTQPLGVSALSSEFLEHRLLWLGSPIWHIGISLVLLAHLAAFGLPGLWRGLLLIRPLLIGVEIFGMGLALAALFGLVVLFCRRITTARLQRVTTVADIVLLVLLALQVLLGILIALNHRWGALWFTAVLTPYLWSLVTLQPDIGFVAAMPFLIKAHLALAWLIFFITPFTRLVHMFAIPYDYLYRAPIKVLWGRIIAAPLVKAALAEFEARRHFLKAALGLGFGGMLLSTGVMDKMFRFFNKPPLSPEVEAQLMELRLKRLRMSVSEEELELTRQTQAYIQIAHLNELNETKGKYFIDYQLRPALAFRLADGLPLLISAKCTHLGCTVGSEVDSAGKILCPCHISFFDLRTGQPNPDAPAKEPLPRLGWVLMDGAGTIVASQRPNQPMEGAFDPKHPEQYSLYIAKQHVEEAAQ
jgi:nitrate reductase gamma subunit